MQSLGYFKNSLKTCSHKRKHGIFGREEFCGVVEVDGEKFYYSAEFNGCEECREVIRTKAIEKAKQITAEDK